MFDYSKRKIDYANRKPKKINYDEVLYIRIDKDLKDRVLTESKKRKMTLSEMVRYMFENYFAEN